MATDEGIKSLHHSDNEGFGGQSKSPNHSTYATNGSYGEQSKSTNEF